MVKKTSLVKCDFYHRIFNHIVFTVSCLGILIVSTNVETFEREKMKDGCKNIHILDILLFFTKIGECYSAPY